MSNDYETLSLTVDAGVGRVVIDHPPINLLDPTMMRELGRLGEEIAADSAIRVVIVESADPDFFIAHADVTRIRELPSGVPKSFTLNPLHRIMERWRTLPQPTIAKIEGRARGGGSEFALSLDMRFGSLGQCVLSQPEVALGIIPGAGGTQRLPRLVGRGRALEVILGAEDMDASVAERYGYLNRALLPEELPPFVNQLARRIASHPPSAVRHAKESVDAASEHTVIGGLLVEADLWQTAYETDDARARLDRFLQVGGQERDPEIDWGTILDDLKLPPR